MANPKHVEILKQGVEVWNRWREKNSHINPDLSYAFFGYVDFDYVNLNDVNLDYSKLCAANFEMARLANATFYVADLTNANFINVDLLDADLTRADLTNTNFSGAHLKGTNLSKADLTNARLWGAELDETILTDANLYHASLRSANLRKTIFHGANLDSTDFGGASFLEAYITGVDLRKAIGLDSTKHHGPSAIGVDTIYKSVGQIPEVFLRGCGVQENFIAYMKSLTMNPIEYYSCFISYSHEDKSFARRLHDQLQARGIRCWLDEHQILPGDDIYEQVDRGIRMWDKVLLCCSKHSLSSWWVDNEVATAFSKEQQLMKDRKRKVLSLIPLNLDGYMFSNEWTNGKRQQIKERLAADFTGWETDNAKFEEQFERVVKALQTKGSREEAPLSKL